MNQRNASTTTDYSRLSLALIDLPLTPFGMKCPPSSPKLLHNEYKTKLSRSNSKSNKKVTNGLSPECSEGVEVNFVLNSKNINARRREKNKKLRKIAGNSEPDDRLLCQKFQARRDSLFTDIDDGSFIEFTGDLDNSVDYNEKSSSILPLSDTKSLPQFYYTCSVDNESKYSTSSKTPLTPFGFHKFFNTLKDKHKRNILTEESEETSSEKLQPRKLSFDLDESVIAGSKDIMSAKQRNANLPHIMNSTRTNKNELIHPSLPDISSLTINPIESNADGHKQTTTRNIKSKNSNTYRNVQCIIISESESEDDDAAKANRSGRRNLFLRNKTNDEENYVDSSIISEDVSIASSNPKLLKNCPVRSKREEILIIDNAAKSAAKEIIIDSSLLTADISNNENEHDYHENICNINKPSNQTPIKQVGDHVKMSINNVCSPLIDDRVTGWVLSSPFKDGSFGTSFFDDANATEQKDFPIQNNVSSESLELKLSDDGSCGRDSGKTVFTLDRIAVKFDSNKEAHSSFDSEEVNSYVNNCKKSLISVSDSSSGKGDILSPRKSQILVKRGGKLSSHSEHKTEKSRFISDEFSARGRYSRHETNDSNISGLKLHSDEEYPSINEPVSTKSTPVKSPESSKAVLDKLKLNGLASKLDRENGISGRKVNLSNTKFKSKSQSNLSCENIIYNSDSFSDTLPEIEIIEPPSKPPERLVCNRVSDSFLSETDQEDLLQRVKKRLGGKSHKANSVSKTPINNPNLHVDSDSNSSSEESFTYYIRSLKKKGGKMINNVKTVVVSDSEDSVSPSSIKENKRLNISSEEVRKTLEVANAESDAWRKPQKIISSSSESDEECRKFFKPRNRKPKTPRLKTKVNSENIQTNRKNSPETLSFLSSLTIATPLEKAHPEAIPYLKNFKKNKCNLTEKLYEYFNLYVFENKLPLTMNVKWNARMTKTAGYCYYQLDKSKPLGRGARIELSTKVIDEPGRLRDTLIHELCHAASWIISGYKDGHGPLWKSWASKAREAFPELPAISRCHSYDIKCKYTYRCTKCGYSIGRHSKSLDTTKKVCGYCYGKFELLVNYRGGDANQQQVEGGPNPVSSSSSSAAKTPRTPSSFALFVKDNYASVRKGRTGLKHKDVMKALSEEFSKMKTKL